MAVFFVTAGYTFRNNENEDVFTFTGKKAKRLLVPYFIVNGGLFVLFLFKDVITKQVSNQTLISLIGIFYSRNRLWNGKIEPNLVFMKDILNSPTWFLTAIFLTYFVYKMISTHYPQNTRRKMWIIIGIFALACGYHSYSPLLLPWSVDAIPVAIVFFTIGEWIREKQIVVKLCKKPLVILLLTGIFVWLSIWNGSGNMSIGDYGKFMPAYVVNGALGTLLCLEVSYLLTIYAKKVSGVLAEIGKHTITILCLHLLIFAVGQKALSLLGIPGDFLGVKLILIIAGFGIVMPSIWKENRNHEHTA